MEQLKSKSKMATEVPSLNQPFPREIGVRGDTTILDYKVSNEIETLHNDAHVNSMLPRFTSTALTRVNSNHSKLNKLHFQGRGPLFK